MILGISKKVIFTSFLFFNYIQPLDSAYYQKIHSNYNKPTTRLSLLSNTEKKKSQTSSKLFLNSSDEFFSGKNLFKKNSDKLIAETSKNKEELVILSDKQYEINDVIHAEGNVSVSHKGKLLKADKLIYDRLNKKISANGNIALMFGDQVFQASKLEYSFISERGFLSNVKGSFNSYTLMDDLSSNFTVSDFNKIENLLKFKKDEVLYTPNKVENWLFLTDKMTINGNKWKSKKAFLSNDLLEFKQVKLAINSLEVVSEEDKLRFKSSLNYLIFDENLPIPVWFGERSLATKSEEFLDFQGSWNIGYENLDKDGYFIGRQLKPIDLSDDFVLDLEPQFLIQRSLKGYTKSFVKEDDSVTSEKSKRNAGFKDYFALKSQLKGPINNWDLAIENKLNSFDVDKFSNAFRSNINLSKKIKFLNSNWDKSFYGTYRDRVWNGSLGEAEIYFGYGSRLQKENTWFSNDIKNTEIISLGLSNIKAEALNTKNMVTSVKGNIFYSLDQKIPVDIKEPIKKSIDISYKYIPAPITKGLSLNSKFEASYSFYENGYHQEYIGYGIGPELVLGNLKNQTFDYTRLSLFPFYKFSSGESVFKFDQNNDTFTLNIDLDQQLFGPIILKSNGTLNLDSDSNDYGEFIDSKILVNWTKRSYEFGIFYQPHNQAGGISFNLFGFR